MKQMARQAVNGAKHGRAGRLGARLALPLLAALAAACATEPEAPPPPGYWYAPYGYYDVPPWDPWADPWLYDDCWGCGGYAYYPGYYGPYYSGPAFYGVYWGGGYHHGWGPGGGHPGMPVAHPGPGWPRPPWAGAGPFPRPVAPGASRGFHPRAVAPAPRPVRSFSRSRR
jgi:hypothetical protein